MIPRYLLFLLTLLTAISNGCIALNLPSERYDDPDAAAGRPQGIDALLLWAPPLGGNAPGGPLDPPLCQRPQPADAPSTAALQPHEATEPLGSGQLPTVPWPRFHPVPTRPVY